MFVYSLQSPAQGKASPTKTLQNGSPSKCPRFLKIKNWETGTIYNDTLHHSSSKVRQQQWENMLSFLLEESWIVTQIPNIVGFPNGPKNERLGWYLTPNYTRVSMNRVCLCPATDCGPAQGIFILSLPSPYMCLRQLYQQVCKTIEAQS